MTYLKLVIIFIYLVRSVKLWISREIRKIQRHPPYGGVTLKETHSLDRFSSQYPSQKHRNTDYLSVELNKIQKYTEPLTKFNKLSTGFSQLGYMLKLQISQPVPVLIPWGKLKTRLRQEVNLKKRQKYTYR